MIEDNKNLENDNNDNNDENEDFDNDENDDFDIELLEKKINEKSDKPVSKKGSKLIGKHSLKHDSIFKGKKTDNNEEQESEYILSNVSSSLEVEDDIISGIESITDVDYFRQNKLKELIFELLKKHSLINMDGPIRKSSKNDFNAYYAMLLKDLHEYGYTKIEIFVELAGYFTKDNIYSIFLLLETKYSNAIIAELKQKYNISEINKINFY